MEKINYFFIFILHLISFKSYIIVIFRQEISEIEMNKIIHKFKEKM